MFAEFLLFLLVFPWMHAGVGSTVMLWGIFWLLSVLFRALFVWGRLRFGGRSVPIYTCARRDAMFSYYSC